MSYHDLSECTLTNEERVEEKNRIVSRLEHCTEELSQKERTFVEQIADSQFVSVKQLFWLRDINDKL